MTDWAETAKTTPTKSDTGESRVIHDFTSDSRMKPTSTTPATMAVKTASATHGPNDTDLRITEAVAHMPRKTSVW